LRHSRIQTPLHWYTNEDRDEMIAVQEKFLDAVGFEKEPVESEVWAAFVGRVFVTPDNSME